MNELFDGSTDAIQRFERVEKELNQALSQKYEDKGLIKLRYEHLLSALEV